MSTFFDLHSHMLSGVDDGAQTKEEMYAMLDMAYEDGIRALCLTPHFSPYLFGDTTERSARSFAVLKEYAARKYPDLRLFIGHELGYYNGCLTALNDGRCRPIANSRYVLVDFPESVSFFEIENGVGQLGRAGYLPILAHAERYRCLFSRIGWLSSFAEDGGVIQLNASSGNGSWGRMVAHQWKKLVRKGLVHVISTDAHNTVLRPPKMSVCMEYLLKYCDNKQVRRLTWDNACRIVNNENI